MYRACTVSLEVNRGVGRGYASKHLSFLYTSIYYKHHHNLGASAIFLALKVCPLEVEYFFWRCTITVALLIASRPGQKERLHGQGISWTHKQVMNIRISLMFI